MKWIIRVYDWLRGTPHSQSVRLMFPFFVGFVAFFGATALNSVSYSYIKIHPSTTTLTAGERFSIDIYAVAHVPVNAVDISLSFSEAAIEVIGVDTGQSVITLWTEEPTIKSGVVTFRGGTFQRGFRGEHLIATVNAKAKKSGEAEFLISNLTLLAGDGRGTPVTTGTPEQSTARVTVSAGTEESPANIKADIALHIVTDTDGDGKVTLSDVAMFLAAWHQRSTVYDFNNDGKMTFKDFAIILSDSFFGPAR